LQRGIKAQCQQNMSTRSSRISSLLVLVSAIATPCVAADANGGGSPNKTPAVCLACHNDELKTAGMSLEGNALDDPTLAEKVLKKVRASEMPPAPLPRLDPEVARAFASAVEAKLDQRAASAPRPGKPVLHRLNRAEYRNAIRDLFGLTIDLGNGFPVDSSSFGFDNIGDVLSFNPMLLEQYLKVAKRISQLAVGDPDMQPEIADFKAPQRQSDWMGPGFPLGSRGGFSTKYYFPLDAEYGIQALLRSDRLTLGPEPGKRVFAVRQKLTAGYHTVTVTFPEEFAKAEGPFPNIPGMGGPAPGGPIDPLGSGPRHKIEFLIDGQRLKSWDIVPPDGIELSTPVGLLGGPPIVDKVKIDGPYNSTGVGTTPPMQAVFVCRPKSGEEDACAAKIISNLAAHAYRQPVDQKQMGVLMAVYKAESQASSFNKGIQGAIQAILTSPRFLFRIEEDPRGIAPGGVYPVSDYDLASRLSFFLWSTIPDQHLQDLAKSGRLNNPAAIEQEVKRMLADPRSSAFVDNFAGQWLYLRSVGQVKPDTFLFPDYDDGLDHDFKQETTLFFTRILREDRSVMEFLRADYTYLNERLAQHYGVPGVYGPQFRLVDLDPAWHRGGILTQGSMLTTTAHPARTSPVLRGKWVLENILGSPPPPPPPGVNTDLPEQKPGQVQTMREQMEQHRANPSCASCHSRMDPIGFALDNYDSTGAWRTIDSGKPIDASGMLTDGSSFSGPTQLRDVLAAHPDQFVDTLTANLLTYALGRGLTADDQPLVREIRRKAAANGYHFSSLILGVAESVPFRMATAQATDSKPIGAAVQEGKK
jgi:hypothetical protein